MTRGALFGAALIPFVLLATLNSAGYRYGASDQAFYLPAIFDRIDPALYPRDSPLIHSQARLTAVDETVAVAAKALPLDLPWLMLALYVLALASLAWGALALGAHLYRTLGASAALLSALTLRHAITRTGTNTLEGYFHPRQLAFALGVLAVAGFLRSGPRWSVLPLVAAALLHPTTALWFVIWLGVAAYGADPHYRRTLFAGTIAAGAGSAWAVTAGPLADRLSPMDPAWLATLSAKDYLFPLEWPAHAWAFNLLYAPLIVWIYRRRRDLGLLARREADVVRGCLSLLLVFAAAVVLHTQGIALAVQMQPARIFWMLDFLAIVYVVWALAEGGHGTARRAWTAAAIIAALAMVRGGYVAFVRFADRPMFAVELPQNNWGRVMHWARTSTSVSSHWLADPLHAALYGTSVRVAAQRDVFVEEIKDSAIGMYDRPVAMRTRERLLAIGSFTALTAERVRALAAENGLDYLVTEQALTLPVAFRSGPLVVYRLR